MYVGCVSGYYEENEYIRLRVFDIYLSARVFSKNVNTLDYVTFSRSQSSCCGFKLLRYASATPCLMMLDASHLE
ncbi:unnamed protein product [Amoebophrya sp. A25]|nr:unnamed protein product [Amoebophrya sp. A25]|eukprot:GSA25T00003728001.1